MVASVFSKNTDYLARNITAFDKSKTEQISNPLELAMITLIKDMGLRFGPNDYLNVNYQIEVSYT